MINWADAAAPRRVCLDHSVVGGLPGSRFLVFEFFSQAVLGVRDAGSWIDLGQRPAHASALLRICPWPGDRPVLAGTDLHFSGGGVEVVAWNATTEAVGGRVVTPWRWPVTLSVAFPAPVGWSVVRVRLEPGEQEFRVVRP